MVDIKTFLGLAMPNQSCHKVNIKLVFWGDILGQEIPNLHDTYIQYMINYLKQIIYLQGTQCVRHCSCTGIGIPSQHTATLHLIH